MASKVFSVEYIDASQYQHYDSGPSLANQHQIINMLNFLIMKFEVNLTTFRMADILVD